MGFLKRLTQIFTGSGSGIQRSASGDVGMYFYVRSDRTGRIMPLRVNPMNDLSHLDSGDGFFVRKVVAVSYDRVEVELTFGKDRKLKDSHLVGGKLVDRSEYEAYLANQQHQG